MIDQSETYKTVFSDLAEVKHAVGKEMGISKWIEITQNQINSFAELTNDQQWVHIDVEKSKRHSPYGCTIAHGYFVISLASQFVRETLSIEGLKMIVNYGLDRVRFPKATTVGSFIRGRTRMLACEKNDAFTRIQLEMKMELHGHEKPACVAVLIALCYP